MPAVTVPDLVLSLVIASVKAAAEVVRASGTGGDVLPEKRLPGMPSTEVTSGTVYEEDGRKLEATVGALSQRTEKS